MKPSSPVTNPETLVDAEPKGSSIAARIRRDGTELFAFLSFCILLQ
jgi:hypothetical protein